jgi:hypothetical protein
MVFCVGFPNPQWFLDISNYSPWYPHYIPVISLFSLLVNKPAATRRVAAGLPGMSTGLCPGLRDTFLCLISGDRGRSCVPCLGQATDWCRVWLHVKSVASEWGEIVVDRKKWTGENGEMKGYTGTSRVSRTYQVVIEGIEGFKDPFGRCRDRWLFIDSDRCVTKPEWG